MGCTIAFHTYCHETRTIHGTYLNISYFCKKPIKIGAKISTHSENGIIFQTDDDNLLFNVLTLMSPTGDIYIAALGTDPNIFSPPRPEARQINYEDADTEMSALNKVIKSIQSQDPTNANASMAQIGNELTIKVEILSHLEPNYHHSLVSDEDGIPMVKIIIELSANSPLTRIRVGIDATEPLVVTKSSFILNSLSMNIVKTNWM